MAVWRMLKDATTLLSPVGWVTVVFLGFLLLLSAATRSLKKRGSLLSGPSASLCYVLLPSAYVLLTFRIAVDVNGDAWTTKLIETLIGIEIVWLMLSLLRIAFLAKEDSRRQRVPVLFLDVMRLALVLVGSVFVVAAVWHKDLTQFLTTLGIGSIVLGLALQETLGNFFAGIALLFERPFQAGDWIRVGSHEGQVLEVNWRAVLMLDRSNVVVVIPNAVLGRERIENFSRPTPVCGVCTTVGFSYNDPPNKVKKVLFAVLRGTPKILFAPAPVIRTKDFADSAVTYQIKYFIDDYAALPDIEEELKTRIWYAARRSRLHIPFPIRTVHMTEVPLEAKKQPVDPASVLAGIPLFRPLLPQELDSLAREVIVIEYGDREKLVEQGQAGDSMFIIHKGHALVLLKDEAGQEHQVKRLGPGEFFGEMALLTGEHRTATVRADGDLEVLEIYKESLKDIFAGRESLLSSIAVEAEKRRAALEEVAAKVAASTKRSERDRTKELMASIKSFFGI